jgi:hypothetical protein
MIYLLWFLYIFGWLGIILKRAYKSARNPNTPWDNIATYFKMWLPGIMLNFGITTALFVSVWRDTSFLTNSLLYFGVHKDVQIPLNPVTAILFGVASDQIADIIISVLVYILAKVRAFLIVIGIKSSDDVEGVSTGGNGVTTPLVAPDPSPASPVPQSLAPPINPVP